MSLRARRTALCALLGLCVTQSAFAQTAVPAAPPAAPAPPAAALPPAPAVPPPAAPSQPQPNTPPTATPAPPAADTWGAPGAAQPPAATAPPLPPPPTPAPAEPDACPCPVDASGASAPQAVRYTLESIKIRGNTRTHTSVVRRYLPFKVGDVFDVDDPQVELTRYRLLGTGFFRDVQFSLQKGTTRGLVVLVIDVVERNTIVVNDVRMGVSADADTQGNKVPLRAYAGVDVAETNLLGTGITLGTAMALSNDQFGLRVRFFDPAFLGSHWMTSGNLLYNDAKDFFGTSHVEYWDPFNDTQRAADSAVVSYKRFGGSLGVGRDLGVSTQFWLNYRLESIEASYPLEASQLRGFSVEPIDFDIIRGRSVLSTLRASLEHDTRDHPFLPTRGWHASIAAELALLPAASDYDYQRIDLEMSHWWRLPWHEHVLKLQLVAGAIAGDAPFFEQYYVGDFSDFLPARVLGINFDRRPPPNFLGTDIVEVRYGKYAFKLASEYRVPLFRGHRSIYGIDFFASAGIYGVAGTRDITNPPTGYSGLARVPVDLTGNLGFRIDTSAGGFVFSFANLLGFPSALRGKGPAGG